MNEIILVSTALIVLGIIGLTCELLNGKNIDEFESIEVVDNHNGTFTLINHETNESYSYAYHSILDDEENKLRSFIQHGVNKELSVAFVDGKLVMGGTTFADYNGSMKATSIHHRNRDSNISMYEIEEHRVEEVEEKVNEFIDLITSEIIEHHLNEIKKTENE